jgi:hypothetical protein
LFLSPEQGVEISLDAARTSAYATTAAGGDRGQGKLFTSRKKRGWPDGRPHHKEHAGYFTGAGVAAGAAGVFEALTAFLLATLLEFTGLAVVGLAVFGVLAAFFFETGAVLVVLVVELCGVTGALEGGALCANIAAAVSMEIKIVRFIFVSP